MGRHASGWVSMDDNALEHDRKIAAVKYLALGLCLAIFLLYGILVG